MSMLETDSDVFVDKVIKSFVKEYNDIDKQMEGSLFSFVCSLSIRCEKVKEPKGSSYIESSKWLRYKNPTTNQKRKDDRCLQYAYALAQHHKAIKNHPERIFNIKPFLDLYNWMGIEFPKS